MTNVRGQALMTLALVAAAGGLFACGDDAADAGPTSGGTSAVSPSASPTGAPTAEPSDGSSAAPTAGQTLELAAPGPVSAKCAVPKAKGLRQLDTPFRGTVTAVADGVATFAVDQHFAATDTFTTVELEVRGSDTGISDGWVDLAVGDEAFVASVDAVVVGCGYSGKANADLVALYAKAFGNR